MRTSTEVVSDALARAAHAALIPAGIGCPSRAERENAFWDELQARMAEAVAERRLLETASRL